MPKNKKYKRRQKGGYARLDTIPEVDESEVPLLQSSQTSKPQTSKSQTTSKPQTSKTKTGASYGKYNHNIFMWIVMMVSVGGILWFFISRSLVTHKYSEAISYGIMSLGVILSVLLLISLSVIYKKKGDGGFMSMIKSLFQIIKSGIPAWLLLAQMGVLIWLMVKHADYLYFNEDKPDLFNMFNYTSALLIFLQIYMWSNKVKKMLKLAGTGEEIKRSYINIGVMILISLLSGICISQIYVILEKLRTDC